MSERDSEPQTTYSRIYIPFDYMNHKAMKKHETVKLLSVYTNFQQKLNFDLEGLVLGSSLTSIFKIRTFNYFYL